MPSCLAAEKIAASFSNGSSLRTHGHSHEVGLGLFVARDDASRRSVCQPSHPSPISQRARAPGRWCRSQRDLMDRSEFRCPGAPRRTIALRMCTPSRGSSRACCPGSPSQTTFAKRLDVSPPVVARVEQRVEHLLLHEHHTVMRRRLDGVLRRHERQRLRRHPGCGHADRESLEQSQLETDSRRAKLPVGVKGGVVCPTERSRPVPVVRQPQANRTRGRRRRVLSVSEYRLRARARAERRASRQG